MRTKREWAGAGAVLVLAGLTALAAAAQSKLEESPGRGRGRSGWRQERPGRRQCPRELVMAPKMNLLDAAQYAIADIYLEQGKYKEAIGELRDVAGESLDEATVSVSYLNIGHVYRCRLDDVDGAVSSYEKVTGDARLVARHAIVRCYLGAERPDDAVEALTEWVDGAGAPREKVTLLLMLGKLYRKQGKLDEAIEVLRRARTVADREEAGLVEPEGTEKEDEPGPPEGEGRRRGRGPRDRRGE